MNDERANLIVASHVVAGHADLATRLIESTAEEMLAPGGRILLMERPHDAPTIRAIDHIFSRTHQTSRYRYALDLVCDSSVNERSGLRPDIYCVFVYDMALPRDVLVAQLSRDYFLRLWIGKETGRIPDIFAPDATYRVLADERYPHDRVWRGHDGIAAYWNEKVEVQIATDVVTRNAVYDPKWAAFDFSGRFQVPGEVHTINGKMIHQFRTGPDGLPRIRDLAERYTFERTPSLPSDRHFG